jgi:IgA Peptidase M64
MSTADGQVLGVTKLVDSGPAGLRWNLVLMGDGYHASELPTFHRDADAFVAKFRSTEPFNELMDGINVFRLDVESTDSGARNLLTGAVARTFFDASFGNQGIERLLTVDSALALDTALTGSGLGQNHVHMTMIIVNSLTYGGSGGSIAVFSRDPQAPEIAMHEMGHTAFGFADEYESFAGCDSGEAGHDTYQDAEPAEPNVTANISRLKWSNLVAASTTLPTTANPDPRRCDPRVEPTVPRGTVGAFEGARYFHSGAFRPEFNCRMRVLGQPFCAVCQDVIRRTLSPFLARVA